VSAAVPVHPRLKPWLRHVANDGAITLGDGQPVVTFTGRATERLLPALLARLDGHRTIDQLAEELGPAARPAIENALALLAQHDALLEGAPPRGAPVVAELLAATSGASALDEVAAACVSATAVIVGEGPVGAEVARLLAACELGDVRRGTWDDSPRHALVVAAPAAVESARLSPLNRTLCSAGVAWMPVLPFDGQRVVVGPLVVPGESACYECYRLRRAANAPDAPAWLAADAIPLPYPSAPPLDTTIAGVAATLALRWLGLRDPYVAGVALALEWHDVPTLTSSPVHRVPRCPVCSPASLVAPPLPWYVDDKR
jgi:bacteriocin biosynthesis cyclodehydratase domain-containing protein